MMSAEAWVALAGLVIVVLGAVYSFAKFAGRIETTGDKLDSTITTLSGDMKEFGGDVQKFGAEVNGLKVVVGTLKDGHHDHEQRIRRIENQR